jgi:chemotaxis protein methyltransferase CheR
MRASTVMDVPALTAREFERFSKLAYEHFGLDLSAGGGAGKQELVAARLGKKLRELGLHSFQEYYDSVAADTSGEELVSLVDLLTTNHTSFFREPRHFDLLRRTIFPALRGRAQIRIWSAACSSGEEPYTIAMTLLEASREAALAKVKIKATDISTRVLEKGRNGVYAADKIAEIPEAIRQKYLLKGQNRAAGTYRFKPEVRAMIEYERLNLMERLPDGYRCSVIFCRNIMIYFDKPTQQDLVGRLWTHLEDGGYLFLGHSESLNSITHGFEYVAPATYRKPLHAVAIAGTYTGGRT